MRVMPPVPTIARTCAVVVLFHPDADFGARLQAVLMQFPLVVLVDNTPGGAVLPDMPVSVQVLRNGRNLGIAAALNRGIDLAIDRGCEWVATFDQDSELLPGYLERVVAVAARRAPKPVLVGCNYRRDRGTAPVHAAPADATDAWPRRTLITSGTFMPARFAREIGGFREDYFIDSVDHEFCLRARRHGADVLLTVEPFMRHRMGKSGIDLFGVRISFQHPATRRYYLARNALLTIRGQGSRYPLWALRQIGRLAGEGFAIVFLESGKGPKLRAFARGLWHGLIGRSGPLEDA
ncbi:MAG: glycosyltransferase [Solimonas sp.]